MVAFEIVQSGDNEQLVGKTLSYQCIFFVALAFGRVLALWGSMPVLPA